VGEDPPLAALGVAGAIGGLAGWLTFLLTGEDAPPAATALAPTIAPAEGGAVIGVVGVL
jgi:hypothetical protein